MSTEPWAHGDKVAFVTGAGGGIGRAVVRALAERGVRVAAVDRDPSALALAAEPLVRKNLPVHLYPADVTSTADVEATVDLVERELGPISYLVNGAGVLRTANALELSDEDWSATFAVNTDGVFRVSRAVVSRMARRRSGVVVTIASNSAQTPRWGMAAYAASKAAALAFTRILALETAAFGIRCNVVAPGSTETPMLTALYDDGSALRSSVEGVAEKFRLGIPLGKVAQPDDIASAVLFLLSDEASHITMQHLTVDGGSTLGH